MSRSCPHSLHPGLSGPAHRRLGRGESLPTAIRGIRTGKMRSLPKLIPGIHHKLPGDAQGHVKRLYGHAEEHGTQINLYITGEEEALEEGVLM